MSYYTPIHGTHDNDKLDYSKYHHKYAIYGKGGDDTIYGGHKDDKLFGEHGNDYLYGGHGNDKLYGGEGNDYLVGNGGQDYFDGGNGQDMVSYHGYKADIHADLKKGVVSSPDSHYQETLISIEDFTGGSGNDKIKGDHGKNTLHGGYGNDKIYGRGGDDHLYGGYGDDKLKGDKGDDYLNGGWGHDTLKGGDGHDNILGELGNDKLVGGDGNDTLDGYGANYVVALGLNIGNPRSHESDTLTGGHGADTFVLGSQDFGHNPYYLGEGHATITDFDRHEGDTIQLLGSSSDYHLSHEHFSGGGSLDTLIKSNGDLIAVVEDTTHLDFHQDFTFV